ncbi:hypothetical protein GCM10009767_08370 [Kocuria aegyptia]|uniref:Uncharacterized protein n=1 Tax=Kocuria aegyptia TaxID=330943 RepID=A0ABN2KAC7_9MICC
MPTVMVITILALGGTGGPGAPAGVTPHGPVTAGGACGYSMSRICLSEPVFVRYSRT